MDFIPNLIKYNRQPSLFLAPRLVLITKAIEERARFHYYWKRERGRGEYFHRWCKKTQRNVRGRKEGRKEWVERGNLVRDDASRKLDLLNEAGGCNLVQIRFAMIYCVHTSTTEGTEVALRCINAFLGKSAKKSKSLSNLHLPSLSLALLLTSHASLWLFQSCLLISATSSNANYPDKHARLEKRDYDFFDHFVKFVYVSICWEAFSVVHSSKF